ncbi:MAG: winged helix-turn-helix domain-containing protein [Candidatus Bathyarchaeota archaeon]|nr:winged helix-turn-helix domain-containing protein [Candidatus Bathyarchaeum sp.]
MNTRNKNEVQVVAKILRVAAKGSKEAEIMDRCKLDSMTVENYLSALTELSLLTVKDDSDMYCQTTEKGLEFLNTYHRLRWLLFGKDNDFMLMRLLEQLKRKENQPPFYVS